VGEGPSWAAITDLDGDGASDLAIPRRLTINVSVLLGNGDGSFVSGGEYGAGDAPASAAAADLNGDGVPDLAVANGAGYDVSVLLNTLSAGAPDLPPAVPTGLAATSGPDVGEIHVSWNANGEPDLDHYYLERSSTQTFLPGTIVALNTTATSFQDWGLVPGQTYYYRVRAVDAGGNESEPCAPVSAAAQSEDDLPPAAPNGLVATPGPGEGEILVGWSPNGEPDLDHYRLERCATPAFGAGTVSFDTQATSYGDSGLVPGQRYYYRVIAVDTEGGESGPSDTVSADALDLAPGAPTGLAAAPGPAEGGIQVGWDANGEPDLDHYRLERSESPAFGPDRVPFETPEISHQDTGLVPGQAYYYRVFAVDAGANESGPSWVVFTTALDLAPNAPTGLAVVSGPAQGEATATWDANAEPDLDRYRVERDTVEVFSPSAVCFWVEGTSYVDGGLEEGVTYYYRVYAVDAGGNESPPSETVEIVLQETEVPEHFLPSLSLAGPNPTWADEVVFAYTVPVEGSQVSIAIYDVSGRAVTTVVDGYREAGAYRTVWDGRNRSGRRVGSGVYLCRAEIGEWTDKRKIVLVR
jgi:fibronectin type 3 domain-containing protein